MKPNQQHRISLCLLAPIIYQACGPEPELNWTGLDWTGLDWTAEVELLSEHVESKHV